MRILYSTDFHGMENHYRTAFAAARDEKADLMLLGGDLCPDLPPGSQADWAAGTLREWIAAFQQSGSCRVVGISGNHDTFKAAAEIERIPGLDLINSRTLTYAGTDFAGFPLCPPSPFAVKDAERLDLNESPLPPFSPTCYFSGEGSGWQTITRSEFYTSRLSIAAELAALPMARPSTTVFIAHAPPDGGVLDQLYNNIQCGSTAIRNHILRWQPKVALHGHVHESPFLSGHCGQSLGATLCINPGQQADRPVWAAFDLSDVRGTWKHSHGLVL